MRAHLLIARRLGSTLLRAVVDEGSYQPDLDDIKKVLCDLSEDFSAGDVVLGLENHDRLTATELRLVIETVDRPWLGICLDTANSLGAGEGLGEILPVLGPLTVNLHIKDFRVRRLHHNLGFVVEGTPAGSGFVHWPDVLNALPQGIICALELWTPEQASTAESAALESHFLTQSAAYLHGLQPRAKEPAG